MTSGVGREGSVKVKYPSLRLIVTRGASGFTPMVYCPVKASRASAEREMIFGRARSCAVGRRAFGQVADPDIAEAYGVAVVLELDRAAIAMVLVRPPLEPGGLAEELLIILDENAVVEEGHAGRLGELAVLVEARPAKGDVVRLPLAGRAEALERGGNWP